MITAAEVIYTYVSQARLQVPVEGSGVLITWDFSRVSAHGHCSFWKMPLVPTTEDSPPRVSGPQRLCWYFPACLSSPVDPLYSLAPLASFLQLRPPRSLFLVVADLPCLPPDSWILSCPHGSHRAALVVTFTRGTHLTGEGCYLHTWDASHR